MLVVLTREAGYNDELRWWVGDVGDVVEAPLTTTAYREVDEVAREIDATGLAGTFSELVVSSVRARRYVAAARATLRPGGRVLSVGPSTTRMLGEEGVTVAAESPGRADDLAVEIAEGPVLFVGARDARVELPEALAAKGVIAVAVVAYETVALEIGEDVAWLLARADVVVIGAPSAWAVARTYVGSTAWVVVPGATTGSVVRRDHVRVIEAWGEGLRDVLDTLDGG
ncbi:MAG: uroporphyrinogen-III synthase [Acidimicrobiales bacterium]